MRNRKLNVVSELQEIGQVLVDLRLSIERIDASLVVRDPGNVRSADAYDGLRKQIAVSAGDRRRLHPRQSGTLASAGPGAGDGG